MSTISYKEEMDNMPMDSMKLERRRDNQQWILDWVIKESGRTHAMEYPQRIVPPEVKNHAMIPAVLYKIGVQIESIARAADKNSDSLTARALYYNAVKRYHVGQHAIFEDDNEDKIYMNQRVASCYERIIELSSYPMEKVEIPWGDVNIQGILHMIPGRPKAPVCILMPGMDMSKETSIDPNDNEFIARGMHVLSIDGPGQGISNIRKIRLTDDNYERAASACVDYLLGRKEVVPEKIVTFGIAWGNFWGARLLAIDKRVAAAAGVAANYGSKRHVCEITSPRYKQILMYMTGIHNEDKFDEMAAKMHLIGYGKNINSPILMTTGEFDTLSPLDETLDIYDEIAGPKELWVFENEFHGGVKEGMQNTGDLHTIPFVVDWLNKALDGKIEKAHNIKRFIPKTPGVGPYGHEVNDFFFKHRYSRDFLNN